MEELGDTALHDTLATPPVALDATVGASPGGRADMPSHVGRFTLVKRLGEGGMGVVFMAYDPELDRRVAVKLLRSGVGHAEERLRMLREAQSMARLSNANVVAVYDVGTHDGAIYIAMEYVAGGTLRAWLDTEPRDWRAIVEMFVGTGRGLVAAHEAGVVHRDFKPDNVLVTEDGVPKVTDFGLARAEEQAMEPTPGVTLDGSRSVELTRAGAIMGTPAYMAPEQFLAEETDPRTDQFAFCVSLHEALLGARPFQGETYKDLQLAVVSGERAELKRPPGVPRRVLAVVERGISTDPDARYPSMIPLLAELERDPAARRNRALLATAVVVAAAGLGAAASSSANEAPRLCTGAPERVQEVWSSERRAAIEAGFAGTGLAYAGDTASRVVASMERYAEGWAEGYTDACEAARVRGEQSPAIMDARMRCYERARAEWRALVELLEAPTHAAVEQAVTASAALPPIARCADVEFVTADAQLPDDPAAAARVLEGEKRLARARTLEHTGDYAAALAIAREIEHEGVALAYPPLELRASYLALSLGRRLNERDAAPRLEDVYFKAIARGEFRVARDAAVELVREYGYSANNPEEALRWSRDARALVALTGERESAAILAGNVAVTHEAKGDYPTAIAHYEEAIQAMKEAVGDDSFQVATIMNNMGDALFSAGRVDDSVAQYEAALAIREREFGPSHPDVAISLHALGIVAIKAERFEDGLRYSQRALEIWEAALGPSHSNVAAALLNVGLVKRKTGDLEGARSTMARVVEVFEEIHGPEHVNVAIALSNVADVLMELGRIEEAAKAGRRALAIFNGQLGPEHPNTFAMVTTVARLDLARGDAAAARDALREMLPLQEKALSPLHPSVGETLRVLAVAELELGDDEGGLEHAERAVRVLGHAESTPSLVSVAQLVLARALIATGGDRGRARELATGARAHLAADPGAFSAEIKELDALLATLR